MMLTPGGNTAVPNDNLIVRILSGSDCDVSSFRLYENGKIQDDLDMIFYGQKVNNDQSISLVSEGTDTAFRVELPKLKSAVQKIAFSATCDNSASVSSLGKLSIQVEHNNEILLVGDVDLSARSEAALILGELYRRNNEWKFRFIAQGFNGGLQPLAEHFGVTIESPAEAPTEPPAPAPKPVNLSKVSLTKASPKVSLAKKDSYGQIKINLNWNAKPQNQKTGFISKIMGSNKPIDLDLGAFVRMSNKNQKVIQALGGRFGSYECDPYVQLQGDDRSGSSTTGEWLFINGERWKDIDEVLIFASIYDGAPNWSATDGVVTIYVPNEAPVETRLTEGNSYCDVCAIARLVNRSGSIEVERLDTYFSGRREMSDHYNWGFRWTPGVKS